jgi:hypothetical protein
MSAHMWEPSREVAELCQSFLAHFLQRTLFCLARDDSELCKHFLAWFLHTIRISMLCKIFLARLLQGGLCKHFLAHFLQ